MEARAQSVSDLAQLSIEQLGDVEVTSVSRRPEAVAEAPSAIYVVTREEILRSGAQSVPEMLRLAPNLQVAQASASRYVVTARGFNGSQGAQNFSNKLLVLIDGRTVYSPLYSGVYWDMQDVLAQDVERIEVISGPGATLWGANAVNGVINIITRSAGDTQGWAASATAGSREWSLGLRHGGMLAPNLSYRLYAKTFRREDTELSSGDSARDHWWKPQAGFRLDWSPSTRDTLTLQGDAYSGREAQLSGSAQRIAGSNLIGRWTRSSPGGDALQVQAYYDHVEQTAADSGSGFLVDTYDIDAQHSFSIGERQKIVWGGGFRTVDYRINGTSTLFWNPPSRTLRLGSAFVQDTITLAQPLRLTLGVKLEDDPYLSPVLLPNARLAWTASESLTLWAAVSRAIRSPTPFDREVVEKSGGIEFLTGDPNFRSEKLTAYELGAKGRIGAKASLSVSGYYNRYSDLRSIEFFPGGFLPLRWGNRMKGRAYGVEVWGDYQAEPWWRLSAGGTWLDQKFGFQAGASRLLGTGQAADDPKYQAFLRSSMTLDRLTLDISMRYVSRLKQSGVPEYAEADARLGFAVSPGVELALVGRNLLRDRHREYAEGNVIPRTGHIEVQWRF